jgi:hypothetical protein
MPTIIFRSQFEANIARHLVKLGARFGYESKRIKFTRPARPTTYTPDFILSNGIIIETKGLFTSSDRKKHLAVREQHPQLDIRFVFQRAANRLSKQSKTTYADWCNKNGFKWADGTVPAAWVEETTQVHHD